MRPRPEISPIAAWKTHLALPRSQVNSRATQEVEALLRTCAVLTPAAIARHEPWAPASSVDEGRHHAVGSGSGASQAPVSPTQL